MNQPAVLPYRRNANFWVSLLLLWLIVSRLILLVYSPHCDPSESRYAEIARKMVETGNWVTPQFSYGVPFWAKPPLSMWMSALGMELFGVNEFGSRIFIFLGALGILALIGHAARREFHSYSSGLIAATLLMGCPLFYYCSAAVMTDLALLLGSTLAMVSFRFAIRDHSRVWGVLFFVGLSIGMLAKGPLILMLLAPPILIWGLFTCQWRQIWDRVPWISGTVLMLAISAPWYILAEHRTPGFLEYFMIGEHWKRFTVSGWQGDLYGKAHHMLPGTIWVFATLGTFPWCLGLLTVSFRQWRNLKAWALEENGSGLYWLAFALWPLVFFTPARNIIATYPLPALPAIAMLLTGIHSRWSNAEKPSRVHPLHPALMAISGVLILGTMIVSLAFPDFSPKKSERELVKYFKDIQTDSTPLLYYRDRKYSAEFYAGGAVDTTNSMNELIRRMNAPGQLIVAMQPKYFAELPQELQSHFILMKKWRKACALYLEKSSGPVMAGLDPSVTDQIRN